MKHIDEDTLLRLSLDTVEEEEKKTLLEHLDDCPACNERYIDIRREKELLESVDIDTPPLPVPLPYRHFHRWKSWVRIAAVLVFGFLLGYGYSRVSTPPRTTVVASYLTKSVAEATVDAFIVCESVDLSNR